MNYYLINFIAIAFGILLSDYFNVFIPILFSCLIIIFILILLKKQNYIIIILFFLLGYLLIYITNINNIKSDIYLYKDLKKDIYGYVCNDIDKRKDYYLITFCADKILINNFFIPINEKILIKDYSKKNIRYGNILILKDIDLQTPFESTDFSYKNYLKLYDIHLITVIKDESKLIIVNGFKGNSFFAWIYNLKNIIKTNVYKIYDSNVSGLLLGLILGYKDGIDNEILLHFRNTGLSHLLVVSGSNITFLSSIIFFLFGSLSRFIAVPILIFSIIIFIFITGADASIIRAGIMGILTYISLFLGRQSLSSNILFITGIIMLILNPYTLLYDVGFQLSFLATFAIIYLYPYLYNIFKLDLLIKKNKKNKISYFFKNFIVKVISVFLISLSVTICTLPIIILNFHYFSIISPIVNVLVFWIPPFIMFFGCISILLIFLSNISYIGYIFAYVNTAFVYINSMLINLLKNMVEFIDKTFNIIVNV